MADIRLWETALQYLRENAGKKFAAREIAEEVFRRRPEECEKKKDESDRLNTDKGLLQALVAELGAQRKAVENKYPQLKTTEERPRKYYWTDKPNELEVNEMGESKTHSQGSFHHKSSQPKSMQFKSLTEQELYPLLRRYLRDEKRVYSMRIDERKSSNRLGRDSNNWLHPDIVGMEDLTSDWRREIEDLAKETADRKTKLWSLEVKRRLERSNVRQAFFQAVSNSSWANFGYLATVSIKDDDTRKELDMLTALHGIGLLEINIENPKQSRVLIPARERVDIDLATCNRLAIENKDFAKFIEEVNDFYKTGKTNSKAWDI